MHADYILGMPGSFGNFGYRKRRCVGSKNKRLAGMRFKFAKNFLFEFKLFGSCLNDQVSVCDLFQPGSSANVLQSGIAIVLGKLSELNSLGKIAFDRLN